MRTTIFAIACSIGLVSAGAVMAQQTQMQAPTPAVATDQDMNPVTCRTFVHDGQVIRAKLCHTKHEWDAILLRDQQAMRSYQLRSLVVNNR